MERDTSWLGLGLVKGGEALVISLAELARAQPGDLPFDISLGDRALLVHYAAQAPTAWAQGPEGDLVSAVLAYDWDWIRFHPQSRQLRWDNEQAGWSMVPLEVPDPESLAPRALGLVWKARSQALGSIHHRPKIRPLHCGPC